MGSAVRKSSNVAVSEVPVRDERDGVLFTREEAARKLGLNVSQINYREIRAGFKPGRDVRGRIVYTEEEIVKMARVVGRHLGANESDVDVAGAAFDAFVDGKKAVDIVRMRLAPPDNAEKLYEKYVRLTGGVLVSEPEVQRMAALLGMSLKSGAEIVEAVAGQVTQSKNGKPVAPKASTATPKAWADTSIEKEPVVQPPSPDAAEEPAPVEGLEEVVP